MFGMVDTIAYYQTMYKQTSHRPQRLQLSVQLVCHLLHDQTQHHFVPLPMFQRQVQRLGIVQQLGLMVLTSR